MGITSGYGTPFPGPRMVGYCCNPGFPAVFGDRMRHFAIGSVSSLLILLGTCAAARNEGRQASFVVAPGQPLMDDRVSILLSGLRPNRLIAVRAKSKAQDQLWWRSEAVFNSGPKGI